MLLKFSRRAVPLRFESLAASAVSTKHREFIAIGLEDTFLNDICLGMGSY
jgi:hypothetical protein